MSGGWVMYVCISSNVCMYVVVNLQFNSIQLDEPVQRDSVLEQLGFSHHPAVGRVTFGVQSPRTCTMGGRPSVVE